GARREAERAAPAHGDRGGRAAPRRRVHRHALLRRLDWGAVLPRIRAVDRGGGAGLRGGGTRGGPGAYGSRGGGFAGNAASITSRFQLGRLASRAEISDWVSRARTPALGPARIQQPGRGARAAF